MTRQMIQANTIINAPIQLVWQAVNDPSLFEEGIDWVYKAWSEDDQPLRLGSTYIEDAKPGLKQGIYRWKITAFDPPHRAVHSHRGGELEADIEVVCEAVDKQRTRYIQTMYFNALPAFRPLGFILERTIMKKQMQNDIDQMILPNYKRIIEQRYAASKHNSA